VNIAINRVYFRLCLGGSFSCTACGVHIRYRVWLLSLLYTYWFCGDLTSRSK